MRTTNSEVRIVDRQIPHSAAGLRPASGARDQKLDMRPATGESALMGTIRCDVDRVLHKLADADLVVVWELRNPSDGLSESGSDSNGRCCNR